MSDLAEYPPQTPPPETKEREAVPIKRLSVLVHPGFILDQRNLLDEVDDAKREKADRLFDKYDHRLAQAAEGEVVVIMTHTEKDEYEADRAADENYAQKTQQLLEKYGNKNNVILSHDGMNSGRISAVAKTAEDITNQLQERGFRIDPKATEVTFFGETFQACVITAAQLLQEQFGMERNVTVEPELTDVADMITQENLIQWQIFMDRDHEAPNVDLKLSDALKNQLFQTK